MPSGKTQGLYIHVPFCRHICAYCDFKRVIDRAQWRLQWLNQLHQEIVDHADILSRCHFDTVYFGGGTPSLLPLDELTMIIKWLKPYLTDIQEMTIEANSEDVDASWIKGITALGFDRLSMGLESDDPRLLKAMHRQSDLSTLTNAIQLSREYGLTNISVDLMYGLPNQTMDMWRHTLDQVHALHLPHLSLYALTIEKDSIWGKQGVSMMDDDQVADMMEYANSWLNHWGYHRYEISNYTLDRPSRHNIHYWHYDDFIGLGYGSSGKWLDQRYDHCGSFQMYLNGQHQWDKIVESNDDIIQDYIMMNTRLKQHFDYETINKRFAIDFYTLYKNRLHRCQDYGWLTMDDNGFTMSDLGLDCQFSMLCELLED